ncbi:MAG: DUF58 domain-containing protein, partial [Elusimicrobia bacterium]|nr:DUF58 domain-containing protein [Elusimicrobiota bacterium]
MRYLDSLSLAKLRSIQIHLQHPIAEGQLTGIHKSRRRGFAQEFAQHRAYVPGDDLKFLDWKAYARKDRFYTKQFQEEKNLRSTLLLDASRSMAFGKKWEYACQLAAAISYLALSQGDAVGLVVFDTKIRFQLPPRRQMQHLNLLDHALSEISPEGETNLSEALGSFLRSLPRRSHLILISDLWEEPEPLLKLFKNLSAAGHELWVLQVLESLEKDLGPHGTFSLEDMETHKKLHCQIERLLPEYRKEFSRWMKLLTASLHSSEIAFWTAFTHIPWEQNLLQFI